MASAIAYSQANMSRTAFVANWLRLQDKETRIEQLAREKSHADYERMKAELQLSPPTRGGGSGDVSSELTDATPTGLIRPVRAANSDSTAESVAPSKSSTASAWPRAGPVEAHPGRPACFPLR